MNQRQKLKIAELELHDMKRAVKKTDGYGQFKIEKYE